MNGYFNIAAQFRTQEEPAYCGLGTLVTVLNALAVDPQRPWKGVWRHYSEELFDCCADLDRVKREGIAFDQLACLARCNGLHVDVYYGSRSSEEVFRRLVMQATESDDQILMVSYCRKTLNQTGSGHFSPIGGYHPERDLVLIMDVARYKYPPHWAPLSSLFNATRVIDPMSGLSRGYILARRRSTPREGDQLAESDAFYPSELLIPSLYHIWTALSRPLIALRPSSLDQFIQFIVDFGNSEPFNPLFTQFYSSCIQSWRGDEDRAAIPTAIQANHNVWPLVARHTDDETVRLSVSLFLLALACQPHLVTPFLLPHAKLPLIELWNKPDHHLDADNPHSDIDADSSSQVSRLVGFLAHQLSGFEQPCLCREFKEHSPAACH